MAVATSGGGAYLDGERIRVGGVQNGLTHLDVLTTMPRWWTPGQRAGMNALGRAGVSLGFFDTSGLEYVQLASGRRRVIVLTW